MPQNSAPPDNPLEMRVGYQLRRASVAMMADLSKALEPLGLRTVEASILILIGANGGITQTALGRSLDIQRANMVPLTAGLMARGLVEREAADGRSHALRLTGKGRLLAARIDRIMRQHEQRCTRDWTAAQRKAVIALMRTIWE